MVDLTKNAPPQPDNQRLRTPEAFKSACSLFRRVSGRIALVLTETYALKDTCLGERGYGIAHLLNALGGTCGGILKVGDHPAFVEQSFMLGRAALEQAINVAYVALGDESVHEDLVKHAMQRKYRQMSQSAGKGDQQVRLEHTGRPEDLSDHPELREAVEQFTSNRERPKNWPGKSVEQRIEAIAEHLSERKITILLLAKMSIYGRASEALHGSLAGATMIDAQDFQFDEERGDFTWGEHGVWLTTLYITLSRVLEVLLWVLAETTEAEAVAEQYEKASDEIDKFFEELNSTSDGSQET